MPLAGDDGRVSQHLQPPRRRGQHHVAVVVYDGVQSLDVAGPVEVFHTADLLLGRDRYLLRTIGTSGEVVSTSGLRLGTDATLQADDGPIDTLVIAGGLGAPAAAGDPELVRAVDALADRSRRVASVCTGAFLLAATGRLDGRRAVTHWAQCAELAELHPHVAVDPEAIYVRDGDVWTSAGVTAGMDLALALVADDHGDDLARSVAGWLVMFTQRGGGQSQFSPHLDSPARSAPLRELQAWIPDHLDQDLSVVALAARSAMSPRHFARLFREETGATPAAYVEAVRLDEARRLLATTDLTVAEVARRVGFRSDTVLHRAFSRTVHTTPGAYRRHFANHRS
jgi:transcriptional regulator GlxA family with amidase domain